MKPATRKKLLALGVLAGIVVVAAMVAMWFQSRNETRLVPLPEKQQLADGSWLEVVYLGYGRKHEYNSRPKGIGERLGGYLMEMIFRLPESWREFVFKILPHSWINGGGGSGLKITDTTPFMLIMVVNHGEGEDPNWKYAGMSLALFSEQGHAYGDFSLGGQGTGSSSDGVSSSWHRNWNLIMAEPPRDQKKLVLGFYRRSYKGVEWVGEKFTVANPAYEGKPVGQ